MDSQQISIRISRIFPDKDQPRKTFKEEALLELADSISKYGIIEPLVVRPMEGSNGLFLIVAGERRWRAAKLSGLTEVPAIVRDADEVLIREISLIENIQREDLNPIEEAEAYDTFMKSYGYTQEKMSERFGKSRAQIANTLRLLKLCESVREDLLAGAITFGHAKPLVVLPDQQQESIVSEIKKHNLSVRETEVLVKKFQEGGKQKKEKPNLKELQYQADYETRKAESALGLKVKTTLKTENTGKVEISFNYIDDFDFIMQILKDHPKR